MPGWLKTTAGFFVVLVPGITAGGAPPKFQDHEVGLFVETSAKLTTNGPQPELAEAVNPATGACPLAINAANSPIRKGKSSFLFNG